MGTRGNGAGDLGTRGMGTGWNGTWEQVVGQVNMNSRCIPTTLPCEQVSDLLLVS